MFFNHYKSMETLKNLIKNIDTDNITLRDIEKLKGEILKEQILNSLTFPVNPSSDGSYHIAVKDDTKKNGYKQFKSKNLDNLKEKVCQYIINQNKGARYTFFECFTMAEDEKLKYVKNAEKMLSARNTHSKNMSEYKRFFQNSDFEKKYIDDITEKDIEKEIYNILVKYDLKKKGFFSLRGILHSTFKHAFENRFIVDDVYNRVNFKKFLSMLDDDVPISERVHTDEEIDKMLKYIHKKQQNGASFSAYAVELNILTGMRRGEIPPLTWEDVKGDFINISKQQLNIRDKKNDEASFAIVNHTKTHYNRKFPITDDIRECLNRILFKQKKEGIKTPYLFPSHKDYDIPLCTTTIYEFYRRMCRNLGIKLCPEYKKGLHSFRRNGITDLTNKTNGDIFLASKIYGNSSLIANRNYFTDIDIQKTKELLESKKK